MILGAVSAGDAVRAREETRRERDSAQRLLFAKMRLRDRAQAVILAYELGLVRAGEPPAPGDDL
ncbi:hypothetical protein ACIOEX_31725 [Streptomyces sp. NPDC087850]|uniref:hypothetical protein n=1 Tax=unclassified Streptomyces TaxID=2593676 RepID=UPI0037F37CE6